MKQLSNFMVLNIGGGDRVSYTYDEINDETGAVISDNNKGNFYVVDNNLRQAIESIRAYIREHKLS